MLKAVFHQDQKSSHKPIYYLWVTEPFLSCKAGCGGFQPWLSHLLKHLKFLFWGPKEEQWRPFTNRSSNFFQPILCSPLCSLHSNHHHLQHHFLNTQPSAVPLGWSLVLFAKSLQLSTFWVHDKIAFPGPLVGWGCVISSGQSGSDVCHFQDRAIHQRLRKPGLIPLRHRDQQSSRWRLLCQQVPTNWWTWEANLCAYAAKILGLSPGYSDGYTFFDFCSFTHAFPSAWNLHAPSLPSLANSYWSSRPSSKVFLSAKSLLTPPGTWALSVLCFPTTLRANLRYSLNHILFLLPVYMSVFVS